MQGEKRMTMGRVKSVNRYEVLEGWREKIENNVF